MFEIVLCAVVMLLAYVVVVVALRLDEVAYRVETQREELDVLRAACSVMAKLVQEFIAIEEVTQDVTKEMIQ